MPFMKGRGALRRTIQYLEKGQIILRSNVKVMTFGYNVGKKYPYHKGLENFVFWHLPQLKFKNPAVHTVTFKFMTPTPWIKAFLDDGSEVLIDCDSRDREEIHEHVRITLGESEALQARKRREETAITANPANFGFNFDRQCMCEIPGQIPCPGWALLPNEMRGKYRRKMEEEAANS